MATREELRARILGKPTVVEVEVNGEKYHALLPAGDVWQEMLDKIADSKVGKENDPAGDNARWYRSLVSSLAMMLCDPDSKALLFDANIPDDLKALAGSQKSIVPKLWGAILEKLKERSGDLGKKSETTAPSSSG